MAFSIPLYLVLASMLATSASFQTKDPNGALADYRLVTLEFAGATALEREKLIAEFPIQVGELFDQSRIKEGLDRVRQLFEEAGYIDFAYTPSMDVDRKAKTVALSFQLEQGTKYKVHRLDVEGDGRLKDIDVRSVLTKFGLEEKRTYRPSQLVDAVIALNRLLGTKQPSSKEFRITKPANSPGTVDITITLRPNARD